MSRIDDLILQYCPNGVDFFAIADLFDLKNGYTPSKSNPLFWQGGSIPWFRMEDIRENGGVLNESLQQIPEVAVKGGRLFPANSLLIATSATIGEHALITVPHLSNQRFTSLSLKAEFTARLDMKFAYYYAFVLDDWCQNNTTTSSFASVDMNRFKKFSFPVPPLEVQRAIVDILDKFTELEVELEAELEARKKQYEYYRESLLTPDESTPWIAVGDLCDVTRGRVMSKDYLAANAGDYPVYSSQTANNGIFGYINSFDYQNESITWTTDGANAGSVFYHDPLEKFSITNVCGLLKSNGEHDLSMKYLYYCLSVFTKPYVSTGMGNPKLMSTAMKRVKVPVPPLHHQEKIATILDQFDALANDLASGLPAEIAARRKQYEYYRDQLLTFKELAS